MLLLEKSKLKSYPSGYYGAESKPLFCGCGCEMELQSVEGVFTGLTPDTAYWFSCPACGAAGSVEDSPKTARQAFLDETAEPLSELDRAIISGLQHVWNAFI